MYRMSQKLVPPLSFVYFDKNVFDTKNKDTILEVCSISFSLLQKINEYHLPSRHIQPFSACTASQTVARISGPFASCATLANDFRESPLITTPSTSSLHISLHHLFRVVLVDITFVSP